ncbi:tetratricopeptide repeat protein [Aureispira anguillae]|uniref:Tetratricopeptide repeat protein n=1 Tax=Aureispira anguillae TaxID=2864201 RepID=A0A915YB92_9BACT|nr:tetratricopeptide repeat protein [Aureispira anguillae]BDS09900.1 tetratricopeptide repeat protein [Aureispira anguillae]
MSIKKYFIALIILTTSTLLWAQESAIYRDYQKDYKRGLHFYNQKLYGQALDEFDKVTRAANLFQDTDVPMYILQSELHAGLSALYLGQPDAEKRLLYFMERNEPSAVATRAGLALGNYYYDQRDYNAAIKYLSEVSALELSNEEIIEKKFKLGYCYFVKKKFPKAKTLFQQIKESKTQYYYPSNYYYGITEFFDKNYDAALKGFENAQQSSRYKKIVPSYICQIYFAKKQYKEVIKQGKPLINDNSIREREQVSQLVGQSYFELGQYRKALPLLDTYVSKTKKVSKEALYQLGYTQYKVGKYKEAIKNFEQLNALNDKLGQSALYNMADCLLKTGDKSAARQAFQKASQKNFNPVLQEDALINYAKLSYELGFDNDAISALQSIATTSDYYNEAQNLMAKVFLNTRDYDKALATLRKMPNKTQKMKETHQKVAYFRGVQRYNAGKYDESILLFNESLKQGINTETKALAYFWKAETLFKKNAFDPSIDEYGKFITTANTVNYLPDNSSIGVAYYGMGYSYIKKNDYGNASRYFKDAVKTIRKKLPTYNDKYVTNFVYPDALLRAGDCLLFLRSYEKAKGYYNTVINKNYPNKDYAMYQLSLIHNLQNNNTSQIALLDKIIRDYPASRYADDAYYAKGNTLFNMNKKDLAIISYEKMLQEYPNSDMTNKALLKLGLIAYSMGRHEEALNYYKGVFRTDPQSDEAKDALAAIKEIYIEDGNPDGYFNFVNTVQGYNVGEFERDSLMFIAAQIKFNNADWDGAVASYTSYLDRFPAGMNSTQAHFNRGEALFDLKRYEEAIMDYAYISDQGTSSYTETANHRAANITYYSTQNFAEAMKYYGRLEQVATTEELLFEAQQFGMRSAFYASDFKNLPQIAGRLIQNARATAQDHAEANYFIGKAYLVEKDYDRALAAFQKNIDLSGDDVHSAEARYWRAYITYQKRDLDKAMNLCFQNNKEIPGHPYWLVKSFILLADIYAEQDNLFQAKATLQSIVDNYDGDQDLLNEAKEKLQRVIDAEKSNSKIKRENPNGELEMIEEN